jgi:hypothetical protein
MAFGQTLKGDGFNPAIPDAPDDWELSGVAAETMCPTISETATEEDRNRTGEEPSLPAHRA